MCVFPFGRVGRCLMHSAHSQFFFVRENIRVNICFSAHNPIFYHTQYITPTS